MHARKLSEIMTPNVKTVTSGATLTDAVRMMTENDIGWLAVVDKNHRLVGTLTDRDIVVRAVAMSLSPAEARVAQAMSSGVVSARQDQSVEHGARLMQENQIRRIAIVDAQEIPVGVVSLGDIAKRTHDEHVVTETMEQVAAPA
jgi:CBS domain-containing protein